VKAAFQVRFAAFFRIDHFRPIDQIRSAAIGCGRERRGNHVIQDSYQLTTRVRTKTKTPPATRDLHERPPEDCRDDTGRLCAQRDAAVQPLGMFDPNLGGLDGAERLST
jgi:hypothetical protein